MEGRTIHSQKPQLKEMMSTQGTSVDKNLHYTFMDAVAIRTLRTSGIVWIIWKDREYCSGSPRKSALTLRWLLACTKLVRLTVQPFYMKMGYPGWRVAGGLFVTQRLLAFALQTEESKLLERYLEFGQQRIKPVLVSSGPVKEVIIKGVDVNLAKLSFLTYCEEDELPYHYAGVQIARHPTTGIQNASVHRMSILGKDKMGVCISIGQVVLAL